MGVGVAIARQPHKFDRAATSESAPEITSCATQLGVCRPPAQAHEQPVASVKGSTLERFNFGRRPVHGTSLIRAEDFEN